MIKVENMQSRNGNSILNQFIIKCVHSKSLNLEIDTYGSVFQSYSSVIAFRCSEGIYLDSNKWDYSTTTGKYRNQFLGEGIAETRKKIKDGIYKLVDLNK